MAVTTRERQRDEANEAAAAAAIAASVEIRKRDCDNHLRYMLATKKSVNTRNNGSGKVLLAAGDSCGGKDGHNDQQSPHHGNYNGDNVDGGAHATSSRLLPAIKDNGEGMNRSCVDATLSALLKALISACEASAKVVNPATFPANTKPTEESLDKPVDDAITGRVMVPFIPQSSKGAGTEECRESARALLRFLGHAPLLHLEGIIWIKMSGQRVHCIAALSSWSLFLVPLRAPWSVGGAIAGRLSKQPNTTTKITEVPLSSMLEVGIVSAFENLKTFADHEANSISRPFRVLCTSTTHPASDEDKHNNEFTDDTKSDLSTGHIARNGGHSHGGSVAKGEWVLTFVGFEVVCKLRQYLMVARESWAMRSTVAFRGGIVQVLTSAIGAAKRYLSGIHDAMTGQLGNQDNAHVGIMEDLADELVLDTAVKRVFFSVGSIFLGISRWLEQVTADSNVQEQSGDVLSTLVWDIRRFSAAAAVLNAAFFHSIEVRERLDLVAHPIPVSIPVVSELLVDAYSSLNRRLEQFQNEDGYCNQEEAIGEEGPSHALHPSTTSAGRLDRGVGSGKTRAGTITKAASTEDLDKLSTSMGDWLVGALNGMGEAVRLFNLENERKGIVRNDISVALGRCYRSGLQPAASDSSRLIVTITERAVGLIEHLERQEQERAAKLARLRSLPESPAPESPNTRKVRRRRSTFFSLRPHSLNFIKSPHGTPPGPLAIPLSPAAGDEKSEDTKLLPPLKVHGALLDRVIPSGQKLLKGESGGEIANLAVPHTGEVGARVSENGCHGFGNKTQRGGIDLRGIGAVQQKQHQRHQHQQGMGDDEASQSVPVSTRMSQDLLLSAPVLLYSYCKLLHGLVCGSYDLRAAFVTKCEADLRNIGREGGYVDVLASLDGGSPRMVFRECVRFLLEVLAESEAR